MKEGEDEPVVTYQVPDICFVIDCSGSMHGGKIRAVIEGSKVLVENILNNYPETKMSIVAFTTGAKILVNSSNDKDELMNGINRLWARRWYKN